MLCTECQTQNPEQAAICAQCGAVLKAEVAQELASGITLHQGAYRIDGLLGQGGFAITYRAYEYALQRPVAIKEFFPFGCMRQGLSVRPTAAITDYAECRQRFLEEARTLARFHHPSIVPVFALFEENEAAYMVMEYIPARTLRRCVDDQGPFGEDEAVRIVDSLCDALAIVHQAGWLHRDIKPDNILLTETGRVVLIDFGTAREYVANHTRRITAMLTPAYAPLEQYTSRGQRGPATDIYAVGATLYHIVTGQAPPEATDRAGGTALVPPQRLVPALSQSVSDAILQALEMEAEDRFQSIGAFQQALRSAPQMAPCAPAPMAAAATVSSAVSVCMLARLGGHRGVVRAVALRRDGEMAATGSEDKMVRLWNAADGTEIRRLEGHGGWVSSVAFDPSGRRLVSGSHDKTVAVWDVSTGDRVTTLREKDAIYSLAWSPDSKRLAVALQSRRVRVLQVADSVETCCWELPGPLAAVAFSADGLWMAAAVSAQSGVYVWTDGHIATWKGHDKAVRAVAFNPQQPMLASAGGDGAVRLWSVPDGICRRVIGAGRKPVASLGWTRNGEWLVVGRREQLVDVYQVSDGRLLMSFPAHEREITSVATAHGRVVVTGSLDETAILWEVR